MSGKQTVSKTHRRVELPVGLAAHFELPVGLAAIVDVSVKTECFIDMKGAGPLSGKQTVSKTHRRVELPMGLAARFELPVGLAARC